jgi:hypothetical protein
MLCKLEGLRTCKLGIHIVSIEDKWSQGKTMVLGKDSADRSLITSL